MLLKNKSYNAFKPYILVIPLTLYLVFIVFGGVGLGLIQSLGYFKAIGMTNITFKFYKKVFTSPVFFNNLFFSLRISIISSVIAVIIGIIISLCILNFTDSGKKFTKIFRVPLTVPHIVVVLMMITLFSKTGFLARIIFFLFPSLDVSFFSNFLFDKKGIGVILVYLWKEIPFVAITVHAILCNLDNSLGQAAKNLGANYFQTMRYILLPLALPTIFSTFVIIFAFSFGAYEVPWLIGPTVPKALPVQAFIEYTNPMFENRPYAMAYNTIILLISTLMLLLFWIIYKILIRKKIK